MPDLARAGLLFALLAAPAVAQWDPPAALWGKSQPEDVRVMTWNVRDTVCSSNTKDEGANDWCAVARVLASLRPDVLLLQECGDNTGHGTGLGLDSVTNLTATLDLLVHGGADPFLGVAVGSWVQKYAPDYDLPHVFVSSEHDGFNRNVILSRWPFADLNGDGHATSPDFLMLPDKWVATGGDGGVRGWGVAEIDLPDGIYAGDLVVGNSHLKAGSSAAAHDERVVAAQRIAYVIDHLYNGAGTGLPDPAGVVLDQPPSQAVLAPSTALVTGGDWNENEDTNGTKGPAEWIIAAEVQGGAVDGTDRDGTDMQRDAATDWYTGSSSTLGTTKFDYLAWQDSLATVTRAVVFDSQTIPAGDAPPELAGFAGGPAPATDIASDHRPLFADLALPAAGCRGAVDLGGGKAGRDGVVPVFRVCGTLGSGDTGDFLLRQAPPQSAAAAVVGFSAPQAPFAAGTLVPAPDLVVAGLFTDAGGTLSVPAVPGGGGPFELYVQWIVADRSASAGKVLSNALQVTWLP